MEALYKEADQDLGHGLGSTLQAVGRTVVHRTLRAPFVTHLYRPRIVASGPGRSAPPPCALRPAHCSRSGPAGPGSAYASYWRHAVTDSCLPAIDVD